MIRLLLQAPYVECATHVQYDLTQEHYETELTAGNLVGSYYDNCYDGYNDSVELSVPGGIPTFGCEHVGTTRTVTVAATDMAGNVGTCDATVDVTDNSVRLLCDECGWVEYESVDRLVRLAVFMPPYSRLLH